ncbi:unnamed protein product [Rhizophagus irregularis]|uniref:Uncharacterized protein n=1 Tax=Rhizophagus irregularis TaxID=588596 RepID=A0A915ZNT0_9GLOM|nr:unnamed protein product [Rhizophagus irregularis]
MVASSSNQSQFRFADVIVMLSMRPAEVSSLQIINYKPDSKDPPAWYKAGYSWYCTGCRKQRDKLMPMRLLSMEKDLEHARELLTWIQDAIKAEKLRDPVYTETGKHQSSPPSSPVLEPKKDIPPPVQQDQSVKVYSDAIKQYASETGLDLQSEELKKAFFAGLSVDNKK